MSFTIGILERVQKKNKSFQLFMLTFGMLLSPFAGGVQIVTDSPNVVCEELLLQRELRVYKDPSLFVGNLAQIYADPAVGWEQLLSENPLLTTLEGKVRVMRLGPGRRFRNFGAIAKIYEMADPRFKRHHPGKSRSKAVQTPETPTIIPVKICGQQDAYIDSLGFVLESDLVAAQAIEENENGGQMPPSTAKNPIPKLQLKRSFASEPLPGYAANKD